MEELKAIEKEQPQHLEMAKEVAETLINTCSSEQQAEFLTFVQKVIDEDYCNRIARCEKELAVIKMEHNRFLGNPNKPQEPYSN